MAMAPVERNSETNKDLSCSGISLGPFVADLDTPQSRKWLTLPVL